MWNRPKEKCEIQVGKELKEEQRELERNQKDISNKLRKKEEVKINVTESERGAMNLLETEKKPERSILDEIGKGL